MKTCPVCNAQLQDNAQFCTNCGSRFEQPGAQQAQPQQEQAQQQAAPQQPYGQQQPPYGYAPVYAPVNPWDHTAEFDAQDISDNKLFAILPYLLSVMGLIIALLAARDSKFTWFHIRQAVKLMVCQVLLGIIAAVLAITIVIPIAAGICIIILEVINIICFFNTCAGKAKEAPIVRGLGFLK